MSSAGATLIEFSASGSLSRLLREIESLDLVSSDTPLGMPEGNGWAEQVRLFADTTD